MHKQIIDTLLTQVWFRVCVLALVLLAGLPVDVSAADADVYITREAVSVPTDGSEVTTTRPFKPGRTYHITISSPQNRDLAALQAVCLAHKNGLWAPGKIRFLSGCEGRYASSLLFDGWPVAMAKDSVRASPVDSFGLVYHGRGQPVTFQLVRDYTKDLGPMPLRVDIYRPWWWERLDGDVVAAIVIVGALLLLIVLRVLYYEKHKDWYVAEAARDRERQRQQERAAVEAQRQRERRQQEAERQREEARYAKEVMKLRIQKQTLPFNDPSFRDAYARANAKRILGLDDDTH